ncbi:MAG: transcription antitermination factor NusB [Acidimicrobiia bacterium]|nr:transcription antitermination factor NusB [Acidimicrobiia bacterium]
MSWEPRDRVLEILYEADRRPNSNPDTEELAPRTARLVSGVLASQEELDSLITEISDGWRVERMPAVDRAVLRLGAYELIHEPETPIGAVIDEAVRLAKKYSTGDSGAFVNGVLSALAQRHRGQDSEEE